MRVAFHAPLKPPDHSVPSGDRTVARLVLAALQQAGHRVELASRLRTYDSGSATRQARLAALGERLAARILRRYGRMHAAARPEIWLTYHLHHKAPDYLGPTVARSLGVPYVVIEASIAAKQARGPWAVGHEAARAAIMAATRIVTLNPADRAGLLTTVQDPARLVDMRPFLDPSPFRAAHIARAGHREALAHKYALDSNVPWIAVAAMMRHGDKLDSYRALARALETVLDRPWHLLIAGDGEALLETRAALTTLDLERARYLGQIGAEDMPRFLAACDLFAWPAWREAYGMALLEAQAAGLPVIAGDEGGVSAIIEDGATGTLVPPRDDAAFARAIRDMLANRARRSAMGQAALARVAELHGLGAAARTLDAILQEALQSPP
ncbi:MAG: glycosyltransferase family 4 protein [Alphaproteobacteria bacterium]